MKKILFAVIIFVFIFGSLATPVFAQGATPPAPAADCSSIGAGLMGGLEGSACGGGLQSDKTIEEVIGKYIKIFLNFLGIVFMIMIIYSGIIWMTAGGSASGPSENVKKARKTMIHAAIGLAVTLMAFSVSSFVIEKIAETLK
jgi:hypothetical protein